LTGRAGGLRLARLVAAVRAGLAARGAVVPALRAMLGVGDYQRYLRHRRARHPGAPTLSAEEFANDCLRRRYERPGSRCC